ncbi:MAG: PQQ-binding-like beta-propeller repeat protein [Planctomycetota bacterium]
MNQTHIVPRVGWITIGIATFLAGCGKKNPVNVVSTSESGVELVERAPFEEGMPVLHWNQWRGPSTSGSAGEQPIQTTWSDTTNVRWRVPVPGRGHGSPIVVGNSVYLSSAVRSEESQLVIAFDRETGEQNWRTEVHSGGFPTESEVHPKSSNANGTIACDGKLLFASFLNSDKIFATATDLDGKIVWQVEVGDFVSKFGYAPSPILYKSFVIIAADNMGGGYLAALDSQTGKLAWRVARGNVSSYSSPVIATLGGRDQILISGCDAVTSYDPGTGNEIWSTECISEATCGTIVTTPTLLFASGGYPDRQTVCLSPEGKILWSNRTKVYEPSLVVLGDTLIGVTDGGIAYAWDCSDGTERWRQRLGGNFSASPIVCNNQIIVPDLGGTCHVFTSRNGKYVAISENRMGSDAYASPAVAMGDLFFRIGVGEDSNRREELVCISGSSSSN